MSSLTKEAWCTSSSPVKSTNTLTASLCPSRFWLTLMFQKHVDFPVVGFILFTTLIRNFSFYIAQSASICVLRAFTPPDFKHWRRMGSLCLLCQGVHAVTSECGHKWCATNFTLCHLGKDWKNWISASQYKGRVGWEQAVLVAFSWGAL